MNEFWSIVVNIIIFILALGFLIVIHELGHLTAAKIFKVYCYEFSVGMGPSLWHSKPDKEKGQETIFSIRAFPVGGYVSMAGEDLEEAENVDKTIDIPEGRTIESKPRYQRIIIFAAGVIMNFILGFLLFAINTTCCTQTRYLYDSNAVLVVSNSKAQEAGLVEGDKITHIAIDYYYIDTKTGTYNSTPDAYLEGDVDRYSYEETPSDLTDYNHTISALLSSTKYNSNSSTDTTVISPKNEDDKRVITFTYTRGEEEGKTALVTTYAVSSKAYFFSKATLGWGTIGVGTQRENYRYGFLEGLSRAGGMWTESCGAIVKGIGSIFTPEGFKSLGGIVATFEISSVAVSAGIATFLYLWGLISVNLAIVNLLPFPGLDGWQILITLIEYVYLGFNKLKMKIKTSKKSLSEEEKKDIIAKEAVFDLKKKKGYDKVKRIVSNVGLVLLLTLAVVLIVKDIFFPVI